MRVFTLLCGVTVAAGLLASKLTAAAIDFTDGIATGALFNFTANNSSDGLQIVLPIQDWILNKIYTYQIVNHTAAENSEAFVSFSATQPQFGFGSAQANGVGVIEVGVQNNIRARGLGAAASRYNLKIKNNSEQALSFDFLFEIQRGFLQIDGIRSDFTAHARVDAMIDYVLLSPAGPFGGTYDETTGQLFRYWADVDFDGTLTRTSNADVILLEKTESVLSYLINPYEGRITLPIIPAFGELTVYYDMYALLTTVEGEVGGRAMLGDPTDLVGGPGISLVETSPVPEPASMLLMGVGLIGLGLWQRRGR